MTEGDDTTTLGESVENMREQLGIDPDEVVNFMTVAIYEDGGGQEVATMYSIDGHTAPTMALVTGANTLAAELNVLANQIRQPDGEGVPGGTTAPEDDGNATSGMGTASRGFD